jgi:hypothetical protein
LTLFTTEKIEKSEVNHYLHEQWARNLVSIDSIIHIEEIPMLGTWKVDHVQLQSILKSWTAKQTGKFDSKSNTKIKQKTSTSKKTKK